MMLPTHALAGMLLALPVALTMPEFAGVALGAGFLGGVLPDLDLYVGHRKTLHFPVYYSVAGIAGALSMGAVPSTVTVGVGTLLLAAAAHSVTDVFGGGLELRPWEGTSRRAVYDHFHGRWIAPRAWIGYDGSPTDLMVAVVVAAPLLAVVDAPYSWLVGGALAVATVYAAVRRTLPTVAERLVAVLPAWTTPYLPARYRLRHPEAE
ncbi:MAG: metal-dependent hydrolase [Haloplanus sp.]